MIITLEDLETAIIYNINDSSEFVFYSNVVSATGSPRFKITFSLNNAVIGLLQDQLILNNTIIDKPIVYPNPGNINDFIILKIDESNFSQLFSVKIYNEEGKLVNEFNSTERKIKIDLNNNFQIGTYVVVITSEVKMFVCNFTVI